MQITSAMSFTLSGESKSVTEEKFSLIITILVSGSDMNAMKSKYPLIGNPKMYPKLFYLKTVTQKCTPELFYPQTVTT